MMIDTPTKPGRPVKPAVDGERMMLSFRVTADTKRKLEAEANKSGRSLSQETELRVQRSFDSELLAKYAADYSDKLIEQKNKQEEDKEEILREVAEIKKRLLDLIELSKIEDVSGEKAG
jgi:hypothetical protein